MPSAPAEYVVRLPLPESLIAAYEKEAEAAGKTLDEFLANHLRKTKALAGQQKPLILTDATRQRIEAALAKGFSDGAQLADSCEKLTALNIAGVQVNLTQLTVERLRTRVYGTTFELFVQDTVKRLIETEVGLR